MARRAPQEVALAGPSKLGLSSLPGLARKVLAESLIKNSAFLVINLGIGAVSGYGSLMLLTHIFSKGDIGLSATAVSAVSLITFITQFGVNYSVPRFLPTAKNRTAMINTLLTAVVVATLIGAVIFLTLPYAKKLYPLGGLVFGIAFVAAACFQAGETVLTTVLVADRSADKLVKYGAIPNFARLSAPAAFSFLGALGSFVSRVVATFIGFFILGGLLIRRGHRFRLRVDFAETQDLVKFSAGMYVASIVGGMPQLILPLVVLSRVGAQQAAYWSVAMSIATLLFSLPSAVTTALLPEVSSRPGERRALLRRSAYLITILVVPALVIAFICAPFALDIFGNGYVSGTLVPLRWLIFAGFITMLNYVTGAVLFIAKKSRMITIVNLVDALIVFSMVMLWASNVTQIAVVWTIGDVGNTVLFGFFAFLAIREVGGRLEDLGGTEPAAVDAARRAQVTATSQQRAVGMLTTLAEQQRMVDMYRPYHPSMTATQGLFSVAALRAAEWRRQESVMGANPARETRSPGEDREHRQAFALLFMMAELQRGERGSPDNDLSDFRRLPEERRRR